MGLRAAVIGCGKIGSEFADDPARERIGVYSHAEAYSVAPETELVAVCDRGEGKLAAAVGRWKGTRGYRDVAELLDAERPELVSVCTPDATHFEILSTVLRQESVRGILAEKPLAATPEEGEKLVSMAREAGVSLAVNYSRRYAEGFQDLQRFLAEGGLGALQAVSGYYTKGLLHNGTHWIDLLRFFAGEIEAVQVLDRGPDPGPDRTLTVRFSLAGGVGAVLHGCDARRFAIFEMDLVGSAGRVRIVESGHRFEFFEVRNSSYYSGYEMLTPVEGRIVPGMRDTTLRAVCDLVQSLREGRRPACTGEDALAASRWAFEALRMAS